MKYRKQTWPSCRHFSSLAKVKVSSGDPESTTFACAYVCDKPACILNATEWVKEETGLTTAVATKDFVL